MIADSGVARPLRDSYDMFIGGKRVPAKSGKTFATLNPYNNEVLALVAAATEDDVALAIETAQRAFEEGEWPRMDAGDRGRLLCAVGARLRENLEEFARVETLDNGKPIRESREDVLVAADCFEYYGGWATKICGQTVPTPGRYLSFTKHEPIGPVGQVTPWNFPVLMAAWKLAPALAAGNTVVLKPSPNTPLSTIHLVEMMDELGLPEGAVNVVTGPDKDVGERIVRDPRLRKIAFTGSTRTGREIVRMGAEIVRMVSLELGGKSPLIVTEDADIEVALRNALFGIYFGQGENCTATSRVLVHRSAYRDFVAEFAARSQQLRVGNGLEETTQMGPLITRKHLTMVERHIAVGIDEGAHLVAGGLRPSDPNLMCGNFLLPTVLSDVPVHSSVWKEEVFGPVVAIRPFDDDEEAIRVANDSPYGLASAVMSQSLERSLMYVDRLRAGYVWVNCNNLSPNEAPFGGYKDSGIGRELGSYALDLYCQVKTVCMAKSSRDFDWYGN